MLSKQLEGGLRMQNALGEELVVDGGWVQSGCCMLQLFAQR
jgi:hypothetical protein